MARILLLGLCIVAVSGMACDGGDEAPPTSTPEQSPVADASSTPTVSTTPVSATGIHAVDETIAAVLARDVDRLSALLRFALTACTHSPGIGGPPKCRQDEAEGTLVYALAAGGCEGHWVRPGEFHPDVFIEDVARPYGAYQRHDTQTGSRYLLMFVSVRPGRETATSLLIDGLGGIVGIHGGCGETPQERAELFGLGDSLLQTTGR